MGTMTRRLHRRYLQDVRTIVDHIFSLLDDLEDEAFDLGDDEAVADCQRAYYQIADTLTDDGKATDATEAVMRLAVAGPLTRAACRVYPELPPAALTQPFNVDIDDHRPADSSPPGE
jgi:hypothetical protein